MIIVQLLDNALASISDEKQATKGWEEDAQAPIPMS
jgi:hypothetical protein